MLFYQNTTPETEGESTEKQLEVKGRTALEQVKEVFKVIDENIGPSMDKVYDNLVKNMLSMEDSSLALGRSMGGFADKSGELKNKIIESLKEVEGMNLQFSDGINIVKGMASEMGRMVNTTTEVLGLSLQFSKSVGLSSEETGKMLVQFQQYGGNQKEAITDMSRLGKEARKSGLDAKSFTQEVAKNLKQASLFGFKGGVKDIEEMVKKTKLLGTSLEKLGIGNAAKSLLDPEKAMEAAANIQMIGGNIGALGDPFQLLYMGQKDMKKLTDEVLNMAKATFTFDKETGAFTQTTEDMYALRAQAEALGIDYDATANAGKELAKIDFIKSKTSLVDKIADEDTQNLVSGLSQISKNGEVTVDIPGFEETFDTLDQNLKDPEFIKALEEYQKKAQLSDKDLALAQMSTQEKQLAVALDIKQMLLLSMSQGNREKFLQEQRDMTENINTSLKESSKKALPTVEEMLKTFNEVSKQGIEVSKDLVKAALNDETLKAAGKTFEDQLKLAGENIVEFSRSTYKTIEDYLTNKGDKSNTDENADEGTGITDEGEKIPPINKEDEGEKLSPIKKVDSTTINKEDEGEKLSPIKIGNSANINVGDNANINVNSEIKKVNDAFFPSGGEPIIMSEGQIYKGLAQDEMMIGTGFSKIFEKGNEKTNYLSQMVSQTNNQKNEVSGKIDFGNLTVKIDAPAGVDKTVLEQMLNGKQFVTHIMNMVSNQKSFYADQATIEG